MDIRSKFRNGCTPNEEDYGELFDLLESASRNPSQEEIEKVNLLLVEARNLNQSTGPLLEEIRRNAQSIELNPPAIVNRTVYKIWPQSVRVSVQFPPPSQYAYCYANPNRTKTGSRFLIHFVSNLSYNVSATIRPSVALYSGQTLLDCFQGMPSMDRCHICLTGDTDSTSTIYISAGTTGGSLPITMPEFGSAHLIIEEYI